MRMSGRDPSQRITGASLFHPGDHVVEPGTRVELFRGRLI